MNTTYAYLAGVMDSDGYIGVSVKKHKAGWKDSYAPRVQVKQTETGAVDLLHETFGGVLWKQKPSAERGRPLWTWGVSLAAVVPVLTTIRPYLRIKGAQADNALELAALNKSQRTIRFEFPPFVEGEPTVSAREASDITGWTYDSVLQAARKGSVPFTRNGRLIRFPVSYLETWTHRGTHPKRPAKVSGEMHALYENAKALNKVGV